MFHELPPTAGLPPRLSDLLVFSTTNDLEGALAKYLGVDDFQLECRGSAALVIALTYLQTRSARRTIIIPAYTCPIVVVAARQAGCRIIACDPIAGGFDLDLDHLGKLINEDTLCVLVTHYGGGLTDVARVQKFVRAISSEIFVVEDAAQAFGARWDDACVGTQADIGIFSFGAGKGLTLYQGGGLVARDADVRTGLRAISRRLVTPSRGAEARRIVELLFYHLLFNPVGLAFVYGMPLRHHLARGEPEQAIGDEIPGQISLNAVGAFRRRFGTNALRRYSAHVQESRRRSDALSHALDEGRSRVKPYRGGGQPTALFLFAMAETPDELDAILEKSWRAGLGITKLFMRAIGGYPQLASALEPSDTPNATRLAATTLTITTSSFASSGDVAAIVKALALPGQ
ncbi:MAG: DegT/DnrJ/EryC1/StrS family aminotransferase [Xanthobacteraceae bacterium]